MATQKSPIKLEGNVGDLTFYQDRESFRVRQRSGLNAKRIAHAPEFARTRENAQEFGQASRMAKCIRTSLKQSLGDWYDLFYESTTVNRLTQRLHCIVKADTVNLRGSRQVLPENMRMLSGFSINDRVALKDLIYLPHHTTYDMHRSMVTIHVDKLHPSAIALPPKATLFRLHAVALSIDRTDEPVFAEMHDHTDLLSASEDMKQQVLTLQINRPDLPLLVFFGVSFYSWVAGHPVPIMEPNSNALEVVYTSSQIKVEKIK